MSLVMLLFLLSFVLMLVSAFVEVAQLSLYKCAWALFILAFALSSGHITLHG